MPYQKVGYYTGRGKRRKLVMFSEINDINLNLVRKYKESDGESKLRILGEYYLLNEPFLSMWKNATRDERYELTSELYLKLPEAFDSYDETCGLTFNSYLTYYKMSVYRSYKISQCTVRPIGSWREMSLAAKNTPFVDIYTMSEEILDVNGLSQDPESGERPISIEEYIADLIIAGISGKKFMVKVSEFELRAAKCAETRAKLLGTNAGNGNERNVRERKEIYSNKL